MSAPVLKKKNIGSDNLRREFVYRQLKDDLIKYRFRPGQHLAISTLCTSLRVSTTPVREALIRLTGEKLVYIIPSQGFFARELQGVEIEELLDLAQHLLVLCLKASTSPFAADLVRRPAALDLQSRTRTVRVLCRNADETVLFMQSLFRCVVRMAGNGTLTDIAENILDRIRYISTWEARQRRKGFLLAAQLLELLDALEAGRFDAASAIIVDCLQRQKVGLKDTLPQAFASLFNDRISDSQVK